jgi:tetratricopeptide (TPR) repeat protein
VEAAVRLGAEALDRREWVEAERHLQPLAESHPDCSGVVLGLARLRAARGDHAEAERLFTRATTLAPDDALAQARFAEYWLSRRQPARADYLSSVALSLDPSCSEALLVAGKILGMKGRPQEAFAMLQKAARVDPSNAEAQYQLGVLLFRRKLHEEAVRQFEKAAKLRPTDARALDYLALGFEALGEAERAEDAYERALEVNDGPFFDSFLDHNYGRFLLKLGRLEESQRHLDRAVALLPNNRAVHYERGKLNLALGRYEAAREDAERARNLRDSSGLVLDLQVYYLLATIYTRLGDTDLAEKYAALARTTPIPDQ